MDALTLAGLALAALIGLSLGLLGGGGSILTVPVFVYVFGFGAKTAIAASLPVVGATSLVGALGHRRAGNVALPVALVVGAVAMLGSYAGARLSSLVSGAFQLALLAVVMLAAAASMLRRPPNGGDAPRPEGARRWGLLTLAALAVGVLTGLVGIGGGFLIVPALVLLAGMPMKQAVGTSLVVIAMNSASGFAGYLGRVELPWREMALFTVVAMAGILAGTRLVRLVSPAALRRGFALFLLVVGGLLLYQNRAGFRGQPRDAAHAGSAGSPAIEPTRPAPAG